ncbi:MAG: purine-binding chemotaxis protein CheW [Archangiaceae bacterium]|nr:purine-binding chemotaxis protein CheW [Archangiaceae bacterium]
MSATATQKYMTFRLAHETYGLPILKVRELIGALEVTRVPGAPAFVRGVVNLRGRVIPVTDLSLKLGIEGGGKSEQPVIIVVHSEKGPMGLWVDEVLEVVTFEASQIEPPTCISAAAFDLSVLSGIGKAEARLVFLLELDRALAAAALPQGSAP